MEGNKNKKNNEQIKASTFLGISHLKEALPFSLSSSLKNWLDTLNFNWVEFKAFGRICRMGPQIKVFYMKEYSSLRLVPFNIKVDYNEVYQDQILVLKELIQKVQEIFSFLKNKRLQQITIMKYPLTVLRGLGMHRDREELKCKSSIVTISLGSSCIFRVLKSPLKRDTMEQMEQVKNKKKESLKYKDYILNSGDIFFRHEVQHLYKHGLVKPVKGRYSIQLRYRESDSF